MSMVKVIEIIAQSPNSWEEAAQNAVRDAAKTLKNIKSFYIKDMEAKVEGDKVTEYRITGKLSFVLDESKR